METTHKTASKAKYTENDSLLEEFFLDELKDIYWAEKSLIDALATLEKEANTSKLKEAFHSHAEVTEKQISRLEEVFSILGEEPQAVKCEAMAGLIDESETIINDTDEGTATRDVGLIMAAQKVEHYEIATYGGLAQIAKTLELDDIVDLLELTLSEEKEADELLSQIARNDINYQSSREQNK